jgi:hypothetical protein
MQSAKFRAKNNIRIIEQELFIRLRIRTDSQRIIHKEHKGGELYLLPCGARKPEHSVEVRHGVSKSDCTLIKRIKLIASKKKEKRKIENWWILKLYF